MRPLLLCLALAACTPAAPPEAPAAPEAPPVAEVTPDMQALADRLIGCWRGEDSGDTTLITWRVDPADATHILGDAQITLMSGGHGAESYALVPAATEGWSFCETSAGQNECHAITEVEPRGANQVLLRSDQDTLKIIEPTSDGDRLIIDGARTTCAVN